MNKQEASQAYLAATIENAPPIQIIRLLYQGALRYLGQANQVEQINSSSEFTALLGNVDDIVVELRLALDYGTGNDDEVPRNLERLYLFCEDELSRAQVERSKEPLGNIKHVLELLLDAWRNVEVQSGRAA
ncbi:MAG: flagellar export chaperone FliS [Planctomycetes bacterium]|nr:flagellar export chaperone FliS [Planctomycetota bacterium]